MALRELHIEHDNVGEMHDRSSFMNSIDERVLAPRMDSFENSFIEHVNTSRPSLDELVIRQRGRKKQPAKISWSPIKSPFKTPTKKNSSSTLHMSLLSPSPAKKLFTNNNTSGMVLRNSPRKRIFNDASNDPNPTSSSTPISTPTKRLRFTDDKSMNSSNLELPLKTILKGLSKEQLISIICDTASKDSEGLIEKDIRNNLPIPDIRPYEDELCVLRKNVMKSLPRSRLSIESKTDGVAYSRASPHLYSFKRTLMQHCKTLADSQHYDALVDYILMAWNYVKGLPVWDESHHNLLRKDCFKFLSLNARYALKHANVSLGAERIKNFRNKFRSMVNDYDELDKCKEALMSVAAKLNL